MSESDYIESENSKYRRAIEEFESLGGLPVVVGEEFAQLLPAAAAVKRASQQRFKAAWVICGHTRDCSEQIDAIRASGLADCIISTDKNAPADVRSVNIISALIAAFTLGANVILAFPAESADLGVKYGFSSIEQGRVVDYVNQLGGKPVFAPAIRYSSGRASLSGIAHTAITTLCSFTFTKCALAIPMIDQMKLMMLQEQIARCGISYRHRVRIADGQPGIRELESRGLLSESAYAAEPEFYLAAAAAGAIAVELTLS